MHILRSLLFFGLPPAPSMCRHTNAQRSSRIKLEICENQTLHWRPANSLILPPFKISLSWTSVDFFENKFQFNQWSRITTYFHFYLPYLYSGSGNSSICNGAFHPSKVAPEARIRSISPHQVRDCSQHFTSKLWERMPLEHLMLHVSFIISIKGSSHQNGFNSLPRGSCTYFTFLQRKCSCL